MNICPIRFSEIDQHDQFKNAHYFGRFTVAIQVSYPLKWLAESFETKFKLGCLQKD
jgi:hypothetical protein